MKTGHVLMIAAGAAVAAVVLWSIAGKLKTQAAGTNEANGPRPPGLPLLPNLPSLPALPRLPELPSLPNLPDMPGTAPGGFQFAAGWPMSQAQNNGRRNVLTGW